MIRCISFQGWLKISSSLFSKAASDPAEHSADVVRHDLHAIPDRAKAIAAQQG
jgi:hypothetical protein